MHLPRLNTVDIACNDLYEPVTNAVLSILGFHVMNGRRIEGEEEEQQQGKKGRRGGEGMTSLGD